MTKTAYSYIRFSSPAQAAGRSQARQLEACERYCLAHGLTLATGEDATFLDAGKSAWKGEHLGEKGQLTRFINLVRDRTIKPGSTLIIESLDRLSREEVRKAQTTLSDLLSEGIELVTLTDQKTYTNNGNVLDLIMSILIMSRANEESSTKSKRVRDAYKKKHENARDNKTPMGRAIPMWLELSDDKKSFKLNNERVAVVKRIFQMAIEGYGRGASCKKLNADGVPSFKGGTWGVASIDKVVNNRAVLGEYQPWSVQVGTAGIRQKAGEPILDYYPAVISEATFYEAQAAINSRLIAQSTKQTDNFNVWQGLAKCTLCGAAMHLVNKGKPPKGQSYLRCYNAKKGLCTGGYTRLDASEVVFKYLLQKLDALSLIQDSSDRVVKELARTEAMLSEKRVKLVVYTAIFEDKPSQTVNNILVRTEEEITELEKQIVKLNTSLASERITNKAEFFQRLDLVSYEGRNRANAFLKRLEVKVYVGKGYAVTQQMRYGLMKQLERHEVISLQHEGEIEPEAVKSEPDLDDTKVERLIFVLAHKNGEVGYQALDSYSEYKGGGDYLAQSLLKEMSQPKRAWLTHEIENFKF